MMYWQEKRKKQHLIVTPDELRQLLADFHHVTIGTGVPKDYTESAPEDLFARYEALYGLLRNGEKLTMKQHHPLLFEATGITGHLENCAYKPMHQRAVPDFAEPCPWVEPFCLFRYKDQLCTSFSVTQFPEYMCGVGVYFPMKVIYPEDTLKHPAGILDGTALDDFTTYETVCARIKAQTRPLMVRMNGQKRRTAVRISNAAKEDFRKFYVATQYALEIL
jgi:hypothetical protein